MTQGDPQGRCTHVKFTYFKDSGKYYSEGELDFPYESDKPVLYYDICSRVRKMLQEGKRPGLIDGSNFHTLITVYTVFGPLQALFVRGKDNAIE